MSGFTDSQVRALNRRVPEQHLKSRINAGRKLTYIEGWYALAQANRIFGLDGWDRESLETRCILAREIRGVSTAVYSARVRVAVHADGRVVIRDGHGTGEAHGASPAEVHDRALKSAETDATKRALATFGKAFGLALYAGGRRTAAKGDRPAPSNIERDGGQPDEPASNGKPVAGLIGESRSSRISQPASLATEALHPTTTGQRQTSSQSVDKSALALAEPRRIRDKDHLRYVASQPCLLCSATPSDAHHIRFAQPRAMGRKVSDAFTVPLCRAHHRNLHQNGDEAAWWHDMGVDAVEIATRLWEETQAQR
jgi:hypothetical protein